jgi:ATP-dependent Clp endopeptidase proteolytic subunit ClpP
MNTLIEIENKSGKIKLNESITQDSIKRAIDEIGRLFGASAVANGADFGAIMNCAENAVDVLDIEINSPGGSVFDGYTIYQEIKSLRDRGVVVNATITGMAASMASVICMACNNVAMVKHGRMMIHEVSKGTQGSADEHRKAADLLDSMSNEIADIYANKTGQPPEKMRKMMKVETWMGAKDALEMKFIDEIVDNRAIESKPKGMSLLSKLFPGNDEVSKLEASILELDNVRAELTATEQERDTLKSEVSSHVETISAHLATIGALKEQITTLEATAARVPELESAVTSAQASASIVATEMLASIGQPEPLAIEQSEPPVDHAAIFATLTGQSRTEYYAKHGAEIRKSITK